MSTNVTEEIQCPICIETLKKPIRMLPCGHNFCHTCLARFSKNNQDIIRCPSCRSPVTLPGNGVDGISRNITLENVIESLEKMTTHHQTLQEDSVTPQTINQLRDAASTYQQENNFQKAVETLQIVIDHVEGWNKLQPSIDQAECLLCLKKILEAKVVCVTIASIVDANQSPHVTNQSRDAFNQQIENLTMKFVNVNECDCAIILIRGRFQFVKNYFKGESRLDKLENIGWLMGSICEEMSKQRKQKQIKEQFPFMEEILEFMENINDVDLKIKCKQIAWLFYRFGFCCNKVKDWYKSITMYKCAITLLKTVFHVEASQCRVFGHCYNNMGVALENTNQLSEAKTAYTKAIDIFNTAKDWSSEENKSSKIVNSMNNLENVIRKISRNSN